ncbi:DUF4386 domain-containing protein [Oscillochloris sp. ZM17-4]|uniref:DUF4386 domain-containing protein n=1 Tax=Oscillochloris sp. ZM17-4 TaxID=2866714 RepID=UPI001C733232|nr:DUF4386 domain-containing protein [Oscillochloris sp. ZM17-4]MBX0328007.1 DUF4386 domain-containing protein [Oscillochloris sp. ZM17-4]
MGMRTAALRDMPQTDRAAAGAPQGVARFAGFLYLVIAVAAGVAHFYVPNQLIVPGDAAATAGNIAASGQLFRIGIASEYVVLLSEVVLSLLLYVLLRPVSKTLALVAAAFRLTMTAIHGLNLLNSFIVLLLLGGGGTLSAFSADQLHALAMLFLEAHSAGFAIGIVFLIPHMFVLGYLIFRSGYFPKWIGILFLLAGCGYLIDSALLLFVPGYGETPAIIAMLIAAAEIIFPLWLLVRGVDARRWGN